MNADFATQANELIEPAEEQVGLPEVVLPGGRNTITSAAKSLGELLAATGKYFIRGGVAMRLSQNDDGDAELETLKTAAMPAAFETVAQLCREVQRGDKIVREPTTSSETQARLIFNSEAFRNALPIIRVLTQCPVLVERASGELAEVHGYDAESQVYAGGKPTESINLSDACELIADMVGDYNFSSEADRSRALSSIITPSLLTGGLLNGRAPIDLCEADDSQTGKGYRNKLTAAIYGSRVTTITQRSGGVGSMEESLNAALVKGASFISLDNIRGKSDSPAIESLTTEDRYVARAAYVGNIEIDPRRVNIMLTSNRAEATVDLMNRSSCVRILKQAEGYQFRSYPEGDTLDHVRANQPRYLGAVFAIVRAWHEAGRPQTTETRHDFRAWARSLDWIVQNIFDAAPLMDGHREAQKRMTTPALGWLREVALAVVRSSHAGEWLRSHQLIDILDQAGVDLPGVPAGGDIDDDHIRDKAMLGIGRKLAQGVPDSDVPVQVDACRVERRETMDESYRTRKEYRFMKTSNTPIPPHHPKVTPKSPPHQHAVTPNPPH